MEAINNVLLDYVEGNANGEPARLRNALNTDFKLYTLNDKDSLLIRSGEQYIINIKKGEKSNRIGKYLFPM